MHRPSYYLYLCTVFRGNVPYSFKGCQPSVPGAVDKMLAGLFNLSGLYLEACTCRTVTVSPTLEVVVVVFLLTT